MRRDVLFAGQFYVENGDSAMSSFLFRFIYEIHADKSKPAVIEANWAEDELA